MKFMRTPLILAAVLLALGGLATWDEWQTKTEQKEKEEASKLTTLDEKQIRKITLLDHAQKDTDDQTDDVAETEVANIPKQVILEMIDGVWRIVAPLETAADEREVSDFIKTVLDYKYEEEVVKTETENIELQEFGLQEPRRVITLQAEDGSSYELRLGNNAPVGYSTYFQVKGSTKQQKQQQVYLGSQYVLNSTEKGLFNFRDKQLLVLDAEKLSRVTFWHRESQVYEVARQGGKFQLLKPEPFKTAQQKVREYIEAFDQVRAEKFIDTPAAELTKKFNTANKIVMSAVFEFSSGESKELTFVRDRGELLAAFAPDKLVFGLPASFEEKVRDLSENFRDHSIFTFTTAEVIELDIDGETYQRVDNDWYRSAALDKEGKLPEENKPMPNDSVDLLLDSLETAEAIEFVGRKEVTETLAKPPARRITLWLEDKENFDDKETADGSDEATEDRHQQKINKLEISFHAHAESEEQYYVTHNNSEQVYVAARSLLEAYTVDNEKSKDSALSDTSPDPQGG